MAVDHVSSAMIAALSADSPCVDQGCAEWRSLIIRGQRFEPDPLAAIAVAEQRQSPAK